MEDIIFKWNLQIFFSKISAHSNNEYNNQADEAAAQSLLKNEEITINTKKFNWLIYTLSLHHFNANYQQILNSLDITPKTLINHWITIDNTVKFKSNSRTFNIFNKKISKQIDWKLTM